MHLQMRVYVDWKVQGWVENVCIRRSAEGGGGSCFPKGQIYNVSRERELPVDTTSETKLCREVLRKPGHYFLFSGFLANSITCLSRCFLRTNNNYIFNPFDCERLGILIFDSLLRQYHMRRINIWFTQTSYEKNGKYLCIKFNLRQQLRKISYILIVSVEEFFFFNQRKSTNSQSNFTKSQKVCSN